MKHLKKILALLSLVLLVIGPTETFATTSSTAATTESSTAQNSSGQVGYNIQALLPENQINTEDSFFYLRMTPDQQQTIEFVINNTSSEEGTYSISINQAYTNAQGFIDYSNADAELDESLPYAIRDIATVESSVTIPANSSVTVPIDLTMPTEEFSGQILSAIQVIKEQSDSTSGITNSYGYVLGLKLTENDEAITRELNLLSVEAAVPFGRTSVVATLQNPTMDAYGHLVYHADVYNRETDEIVRTVDYDNDMQMAPNSTYGFAIDWEDNALQAGDYRLVLTVSDALGNVWDFDENFTITQEEANDVNTVTINQVADDDSTIPLWVFILIGILAALLVIFIIWLILAKRHKKEEEAAAARKKQKRKKQKPKKKE